MTRRAAETTHADASDDPALSGVIAVVNPAADRGRAARRWQALVERLHALGVDARAELTRAPGDAARIVAEGIEAGTRRFVLFGGDGTVGEAVSGLVDDDGTLRAGDVEFALVHQGTGGDFARALGIPHDAQAALAVAAAGTPRVVDIGVVRLRDGTGSEIVRAFANCVNVGLGPDVIRRADQGGYKRFGRSAGFGIAAVVGLLSNQPHELRVTVDGTTHDVDVTELVVSNGRYMGGGMHVAPSGDPSDGEFDLVLVGTGSSLKLVPKLVKLYRGTHIDDELVRWERCTSVEIDARGSREIVALDGELTGFAPARIDILAGALRVRVPEQ